MNDLAHAYTHLSFGVNVVLPALLIAAMVGATIAFAIAARKELR